MKLVRHPEQVIYFQVDTTPLTIPVPGWTADKPDLNALVPAVQSLVRAYNQNAVQVIHQAIQDFRALDIPALNQAVQACQALNTEQNRNRLNQVIQTIQQSAQVMAGASADVSVSRQNLITAGQQMRDAVHSQSRTGRPFRGFQNQRHPVVRAGVSRCNSRYRMN